MEGYRQTLRRLRDEGNLRSIPGPDNGAVLDFSTNDYLGIGADTEQQKAFLARAAQEGIRLTSSASRLLASDQSEYSKLERLLAELYGRPALLFNSGYHANTGLISALCDNRTLIAADRLVHASIIDGIRLSGAPWRRWRHNDLRHLEKTLEKEAADYDRVLIVVESVYSMDGDRADLRSLVETKRKYPNALLYVDEAHAFGVEGPQGLGLSMALGEADAGAVDIIVGTFGKAAASSGAFAAMSPTLRDYALNRARSFIFSTALPPLNCAWTRHVVSRMTGMDAEREHLRLLCRRLHDGLAAAGIASAAEPSHIQPVVIGDAHRAVEISHRLLDDGIKVLPIRTPTVPPGTERLRISLSAANTTDQIDRLINALTLIL